MRIKSVLRFSMLALMMSLSVSTSAAERAKRPMSVFHAHALGLEVWVEQQPAWTVTEFSEHAQSVLLASTPPHYYPPATLSYATLHLPRARTAKLAELARGMIDGAARRFGVQEPGSIALTPARYNNIPGYEATFVGSAEGARYDVKVFVGRQPGRSPIALEAYTLEGKLPALNEALRRAWSHVRYMEAEARTID